MSADLVAGFAGIDLQAGAAGGRRDAAPIGPQVAESDNGASGLYACETRTGAGVG
jgi:hypothetical protein